jgi:hypothetical protein
MRQKTPKEICMKDPDPTIKVPEGGAQLDEPLDLNAPDNVSKDEDRTDEYPAIPSQA